MKILTPRYRHARLYASAFSAAVCAAMIVSAPQHCNADPIGDALNLVTQKLGPAVVSVRAVESFHQQVNGQTRDTDVTIDFRGIAISPDGLIMCSNSYFSGERLRQAYQIPDDATNVELILTPREIRVTVGDEPTEYYATVAASDSNLGLDFLQIRDLKGRALSFVDLAAASTAYADPIIGAPTASVTRLDKLHEYATLAIEDRVAAIISKPRKGFLPEGVAGGLGLPVCSVDGTIIGVITSAPQEPESTEDAQSDTFARIFNDDINLDHSEIIVPVTTVSPLVALAKAQAALLPPFTPPAPAPVIFAPAKPAAGSTATPAPAPPAPATPAAK